MKKTLIIFFIIINYCGLYSQELRIINCQFVYHLACPGNTSKVIFTCLIPNDIDKCQDVLSLKFSHSPSKVFTVKDNKYAEFTIENPQKSQRIIISTKIKLFSNNLYANKKNRFPKIIYTSEYLNAERSLESNHPIIKEIALKLKDKNEIKTIKNIFKFVVKKFKYKTNGINAGALGSLNMEYADCSEYSDLFVTLCRASGIPSRVNEGCVTENAILPWHAWAEVYLQEYGWVRFEPTKGFGSHFERMSNNYIQLSNVKNDAVLNNSYCISWGDKVEITRAFKIIN